MRPDPVLGLLGLAQKAGCVKSGEFMAENMIEDPNEIKNFDRLGYVFRNDLSKSDELVFERRK